MRPFLAILQYPNRACRDRKPLISLMLLDWRASWHEMSALSGWVVLAVMAGKFTFPTTPWLGIPCLLLASNSDGLMTLGDQ